MAARHATKKSTKTARTKRSAVTSTAQGRPVPGMSKADAGKAIEILQGRLGGLIDLAATIKHVHWNVVGPGFIGVHQMLDPHHAGVSAMVDAVAERISTLGGSPNGLPGYLVAHRSWDDYDLDRALVHAHLAALDVVYDGCIESHRAAIDATEDLDPVTNDMLVQQTGELEMYQWFVRAHLMDAAGAAVNAGASTETSAARAGAKQQAG